MIAAVHHGGTPPWWVAVLFAAREWGTPPWVIAGSGSRLLWMDRWALWNTQMSKARNRVTNG